MICFFEVIKKIRSTIKIMNTLDNLCVNTIRMLSADCVERANSGHPGMPMGAAPMAYVLWTMFLRHNPSNPAWFDRDRFVLSAGHGSALIYSLLHLTGYDLTLEDLKGFRQWGSKTPGHPEYGLTPGVETTTGPLGQGFANGVGMAIAERFLAARFNRPGHHIVDHYTYGIAGDGDLMEGLSHEAASLAGHLKLGRLIYLYDDNKISIEGSTEITFTEDVKARFRAYGWHVDYVDDGNDLDAIRKAITAAQQEVEKPSLIAVSTLIGYGSPNKEGLSGAHGEPLGPEEIKLARRRLGWPEEKVFFVPDEALSHFRKAVSGGKALEREWEDKFNDYRESYPDLAGLLEQTIENRLPDDWDSNLPVFPADDKGMATRVASGKALNAIAPRLLNLIGGSADLAPSNKTLINNEKEMQTGAFGGRNIRFGVREHAMGSILNGMALHGLIPYGGTFLVFSDYMRPAIRMAALMGLRIIYVFTHDSIGLGEDGPTHQPVEHLASLRAIPNLTVIRPADANETTAAWRVAITSNSGPVAMALTRQALPVLDRTSLPLADGLFKGAYILNDPPDKNPDIILVATGSEVHVALAASQTLEKKGLAARVVSMPSWELFEKQPEEYRRQVLLNETRPIIAVEAGIRQGWRRYVGANGAVIGLDRFGASAPAKNLFKKFGITADAVVEKALDLLDSAT
jgi:transketolase